jgi:hypothetical protein
MATVGVVWSQTNEDFYGRDESELLVGSPWRGVTQALVRARIPYLPVHADLIDRDGADFSTLILPNLGSMSGEQIAAVGRFVARGGGLLATGESSLFDEWGEPRSDFALADMFGAHVIDPKEVTGLGKRRKQASETAHTYLRLTPERRGLVDGPRISNEPVAAGQRHEVLRGFEETDLLPFGGVLDGLKVIHSAQVPLTFVPAFPVYPPETAWMREPKTDVPGLILNTAPSGARIAFLPADIDRRFARDNLPDHGDLLANLVRWTDRQQIPLVVEGPGLIDCHLYQQPGRVILHMVNLTSAGAWRQPVHELIPVGPIHIRLRLPPMVRSSAARLLVGSEKPRVVSEADWVRVRLNSILDHEVLVVGR